MFKEVVETYTNQVVNHPWRVIILSLLLMSVLSAGTLSLTFRSDDRVFFSTENPELLALENFEAKYGRDDNIVFILSAKEGDLFTPEKLDAINSLTDQAWRMPYVKRVDSVTNFQRVTAQGDDIIIDHLARSGDPMNNNQSRTLKAAALQETMLVGSLLSLDARTGLVAVQFRLTDEIEGDVAGELMQAARKMAADFASKYPELEIRISGGLALDNAFGEAGSRDGVFLTPIMFGLIFILIGLIFRSFSVVLAAFLVIGAAIGAAMGTAGLLQIPLSSPSIAAPFIILTLATADCIHLAAAIFRDAYASPEKTKKIAVRTGLLTTFRPITLTSLTTAIGFFSLTFSESPPFAHLGIISGIGVIYAWMLSVTLLPALMVVLPWRARSASLFIPESGWRAIHRFIMRRPAVIALTVFTIGTTAAGLAFTNVLDDNYVAYFDRSFEFRQDTDYLNQQLGGFYRLEYSLDAGKADGVSAPFYLQQIDAFAYWLREQPEVTHVAALSDIMRTINQGMNGGGEESYQLPNDGYLAAQYLMLYEMSLPLGLDLREQVTTDKSESRMNVALRDLSTVEVLDLVNRAKVWVENNAPLLVDSAMATGTTVLFSYIGQRNIEQMLFGTFIALALISVLLFIAFQSAFLGSIAIVTNVIPPMASLGGWALLVGEVGMAVATIAAVTLGIVVDDTIHFIEAAQRAKRRGVDNNQAVLEAMLKAGPGIITTTLVLVVGFASLATSGFQINAWMGLMTAIVISVALVFDMLFLTAVLIKMRNWK